MFEVNSPDERFQQLLRADAGGRSQQDRPKRVFQFLFAPQDEPRPSFCTRFANHENMAENLDSNGGNPSGDGVHGNGVHNKGVNKGGFNDSSVDDDGLLGDGIIDADELTLFNRAVMWKATDSPQELEDLEEDIILAFHSIENESDEKEFRAVCLELLERGDLVPLLQRAQLLLFMAATEREGDYQAMRETLEEAELYIRRLEDLVNIGAGNFSPRIEPLGTAIRKSLHTVNEGEVSFRPKPNVVN